MTQNLGGCTVQSQRLICKSNGSQLLNGLDIQNFGPVCDWVRQIGYHGPLAGGTNQTVCVKALRHHNGYVVGAQGGEIGFSNTEDLESKIKNIVDQGLLCNKVGSFDISHSCSFLILVMIDCLLCEDSGVYHPNTFAKLSHLCSGFDC